MSDHIADAGKMVPTRAEALRSRAEGLEAGEDVVLVLAEAMHAAFDIKPDTDADAMSRAWDFFWKGAYLDAVSAFQDAVLPGWRIARLWQRRDGKFEFCLEKRSSQFAAGEAPTLCQAWLAAILRALAVEADNAQ